jgi:transposase
MSHDDVLFGFRLRLFTLAEEIGVRPACRAMGVHHSTYYRWKKQVDRWGLEALRVRERQRPRMPNQIGPHLEQRVMVFALAHPGFGPRRVSAELARPKWGGIRVSEHGVWRVLKRFNLNTRAKRLALIARHADPYERRPERERVELHIDATEPGEKVQMDCFYVGRLAGTKGTVWQIHGLRRRLGFSLGVLEGVGAKPPGALHTGAGSPGRSRTEGGWLAPSGGDHRQRLEFRSREFVEAVEGEDASHRRIKAGRPNSNGCVERAQLTILEECWRPAFARSLAPKITALDRDLDEYLHYFNCDRAHTGRLTRGRVPGEIVYGARKMGQVR